MLNEQIKGMFHRHAFNRVKDRTDSMFICECGVKLRIITPVTLEIEEMLSIPGFDLQNLPGGTEFMVIAPNGNTMPFRVATLDELILNAETQFNYWNEQLRLLREAKEKESGLLEEEEWPELFDEA